VIARLARVHREFLGLNRRNHGYLFAYNPRTRYHVVDDKRATKEVLATRGVPAPATLDVVEAPWQIAALAARLARRDTFVLKPTRGTGGAGIVVVAGRDGDDWAKASGDAVTWRAIAAHAADVIAGTFSVGGREDVLLVEDLVLAEPTLAAVSYQGVPDVRVLVFRGVPVLAMVRLPTRRSDGRANLHLGGVGVGVDMATGRTTHAVVGRRAVDRHPDLDVPLHGIGVPAWDDVLRIAVDAADAVGLGFLGVDVVLDARHGPLVLELNARPGLAIQMANRRGLRPVLEAVARADVPVDAGARVALGVRLSSGR
jgi:alpha-L-glutamate ligase-like protein